MLWRIEHRRHSLSKTRRMRKSSHEVWIPAPTCARAVIRFSLTRRCCVEAMPVLLDHDEGVCLPVDLVSTTPDGACARRAFEETPTGLPALSQPHHTHRKSAQI